MGKCLSQPGFEYQRFGRRVRRGGFLRCFYHDFYLEENGKFREELDCLLGDQINLNFSLYTVGCIIVKFENL